jgi:hypothetical protein
MCAVAIYFQVSKDTTARTALYEVTWGIMHANSMQSNAKPE